MTDDREMYNEISALVGSIGKALELDDKTVAQDLESGRIQLDMAEDENGNRYLAVMRDDRSARVYKDAILHDRPPGDAGDDDQPA